MKIRNGFVSNSSSSSFVVFIKPTNDISLCELPSWLKKNKFEDHELWVVSAGGCDGDFIRCLLDEKTLGVFLRHPSDDNITILVDPIWKSAENFGFMDYWTKPVEITEDMVGMIWDVLNIDYNGPKDVTSWKEYFGEITHEEAYEIYKQERLKGKKNDG